MLFKLNNALTTLDSQWLHVIPSVLILREFDFSCNSFLSMIQNPKTPNKINTHKYEKYDMCSPCISGVYFLTVIPIKSVVIPAINAKIKNQLIKKKKFTRFIKGKLSFSKKGIVEFEVHTGQESFRIKPFTKSNAWGLFPSGKDKFKKGDFIECYTPTGIN